MLSYNYPGVSNNVVVSPDTYATLAQHPNIVGCKMYVFDKTVDACLS